MRTATISNQGDTIGEDEVAQALRDPTVMRPSAAAGDPPSSAGGPRATGLVPVVAGGLIVLAAVVATGCGGSSVSEFTNAAANGQALAQELGCAGCHGGRDSVASIGPSWVGSWGDEIVMSDGTAVRFDAAYVMSSVRQPDLHRRKGDWRRMPTFAADQLTNDELDEIVAYIEELG